MTGRTALPLAALLILAAAPARAGETACWFEHGLVVVPASVMGVAGDYLLDTGTAQTTLADTQAQTAGFEATQLVGEVRIAGLTLPARPVAVANLDMRTGALPTPVAGVIGADLLKAFVLDVRFAPCRIRLARPGTAFGGPPGSRLPLRWIAGVPTVPGGLSDGPSALSGALAVALASDAPVRINDMVATAPGAAKPKELYPGGILRPRLRALSLGGNLAETLPAGLIKLDPDIIGMVGAPVLSRWRLRFDFPAGTLALTPNEKDPPAEAGGP